MCDSADFALEYGLFGCGKKRVLIKSVIDIRTMLSVHNASELWTLSFYIYSTYLIFVCKGAGSKSLLVFCQAVAVLGRHSTTTRATHPFTFCRHKKDGCGK